MRRIVADRDRRDFYALLARAEGSEEIVIYGRGRTIAIMRGIDSLSPARQAAVQRALREAKKGRASTLRRPAKRAKR